MRKYKVQSPNFRCKVIDHHNKEIMWIGYADSEAVLRPALLRRFKQIVSIKISTWRDGKASSDRNYKRNNVARSEYESEED